MHLFIRDDFMAWFKAQGRNPSTDNLLEFRMSVAQAIEKIIQRMVSMTGETERKKVYVYRFSEGIRSAHST
jgi:hypothetical protein